ncbi:MAG: hypothetical protein M0C28_28480 [Candidatus Moduliflexus flocculans]|nr:hypothetical protein [Candidatus Moduliflexus flocculans]
MLVLVIDPFWKEENRRNCLGWLTAGGLLAAMVVSLLFGQPGRADIWPSAAWSASTGWASSSRCCSCLRAAVDRPAS